MSFRSSSKIIIKSEYSSDTLDSRIRKENFNKIRNIFEIKRPNKSPNSTLRKSKSVSSLTLLGSDDEKEIINDKLFMRTDSLYGSSTLSEKYKRKSTGRTTRRKTDRKLDSLEQETTEALADESAKQSDGKENSPELHSTLYDEHFHSYEDATKKDYEQIQFERKYIKNNSSSSATFQNSLGRRNKLTKEIISRKQRKENRETVKSFIEANSEGETESYRKSLVEEMDLQVAKMKSDGFIDEDDKNANPVEDNVFEDTNDINESIEQDTDKQTEDEVFYWSKRNSHKHNRYKNLFEGIFSELDRSIKLIQAGCNIEIATKLSAEEEHRNADTIIQKDVEARSEPNEMYNNRSLDRHSVYDEIHSNRDNVDILDYEKTDAIESMSNSNSIYEDNIYDEVHVEENDESTNPSNEMPKSLDHGGHEGYNKENDASSNSNNEDDIFGSLGDDLENGSYFVEAYNIPGKELVIVEISLERRTVNLDQPFSLESITKSMNAVDMVFHKKEDKSLNVIDDPKAFVSENAHMLSNGYFNDPESNRSTVYSTTSRDSDVFDTDDEGISMGNVERKTVADDNSYNNVRRETFCDDKGIVRIERVGYPETAYFREDGSEPQTPVSRNNSFAQKGKLSYIIDEIKSTEKKYVEDLYKVVKRYIPYIERHTPPSSYGKQLLMFGNIQTLWEHQKEFLAALESCGEEVEDIVKTFIDFKDLFKLYPKYFKNKPRADVVLREFSPIIRKAQDRFKERLDLSSYLLTPLQRLGKYKLFLENIEKQLQKLDLPTDTTSTALEIIKTEMSKGNDFVAIESIDNSPILKTDYGSFKMREIFTIVRPRRLESMVFLFENVVVFTSISSQKNEIYIYHDSIKMIDLRIATFEDSTIHLTDFTKGKKVSRADRFTYVLEAKSEKIKDIWRKAIEDILWQQLYKVKENTLRLYQTNGNKRNKAPRNRVKSTGFSVFYCD